MKHQTRVYCSSIIKGLIPKAKTYEKKVIEIASKFGKDLAKVEQDAAEIYSTIERKDKSVLSYYDNQARWKAEEEQRAEEKALSDRRKVYIESKMETLVPAARLAIRSAQAEFQEEARKVAQDLREHLEKDIATPLNDSFIQFARVFNEFGIPLTELDCSALLSFSDDNPTAYRVIDSIIKKTNSPFNFTGKDTDSFTDDIKFVEDLASDNCFCAPQEVFHEINELFVGEPVHQEKSDSYEERIESGRMGTFDSVKLSMCSGSFAYSIEKLGEVSESWISDPKVEYDPIKAMAQERPENQETVKSALEAYIK